MIPGSAVVADLDGIDILGAPRGAAPAFAHALGRGLLGDCLPAPGGEDVGLEAVAAVEDGDAEASTAVVTR